MTFGCLLFVILGCYLMFKGIDTTIKTVDNYQKEQKAAEEKLDKEMPKGSVDRLKHNVKEALGSSNRGNQRYEITITGGALEIYVFANDNLTPSLIRSQVKSDIFDTLKAIHDSQYDYTDVEFTISEEFADKFGNTNETPVVLAKYSQSTVDRINWKNFIFTDILDVADSKTINPVFNRE